MSSTRRQVAGIISTCKTVIAAGKGKDLPPVDGPISTVGAVILEQAKAEHPNDKVLGAVKLDAHVTWTTLLAAMETIRRTLPPPWVRAEKPTKFS
jgi:hypothetical protein